MEKEQRNRLQKATQDARRLLEEEFRSQLLQTYDIDVENVRWAEGPGAHLQAEQRLIREKLVAWIEHKEAQINDRKEALLLALREMAFTALNRFVALKLMEARELVRPCVSGGLESAGFLEFTAVAQGLLADQESSYRLYLETIFEDVSRELRALFDPRDPASLLWPKRGALLELLDILNRPELAELWIEDETLGWVYQYFNGDAERKKMREESSAPRNSRELAVRNQFFTPRYVVEFLTDNTLGRIWYEMRQGNTGLKDRCRYLVRRPNEVWLQPGEEPPAQPDTDEALSQEELLRQPIYIPHRLLKDPREIRMLDPACGSMHFGLYAFDLYLAIYEEAWEIAQGSDEQSKQEEAFSPFVAYAAGFADKSAFLREVPRLILQYNINGIDIDPRATQIARLTLWLRAQRAWQEQQLEAADRPPITRSNVVCAEPMPGERELLGNFVDHQFPEVERGLVHRLLEEIFDKMQLAGEAGSLLKIDREIRDAIDQSRREWQRLAVNQGDLFSASELAALGKAGPSLNTDLQNLTKDFWLDIEGRIYGALRDYAEQTEDSGGFRRRLFAEDAAQGFAFIDLYYKRYDVVVMNPPFGNPSISCRGYLSASYPKLWADIYSAFVERGLRFLCQSGRLGAITSRTFLALSSFETLRDLLLDVAPIQLVAECGLGVLDDATVRAAFYVAEHSSVDASNVVFWDLRRVDDRGAVLLDAIKEENQGIQYSVSRKTLRKLPGKPFAYWLPERFLRLLSDGPHVDSTRVGTEQTRPIAEVAVGASTTDDPRLVRCHWEVEPKLIGPTQWTRFAHAVGFCRFYAPSYAVLNWGGDGKEMLAIIDDAGNIKPRLRCREDFLTPGLVSPYISERGLGCSYLPKDHILSNSCRAFFKVRESPHALVAYLNSSFIDLMIWALTPDRKHEAGIIAALPVPADLGSAEDALSTLSQQCWEKMVILRSFDECDPYHCPAFIGVSAKLQDTANKLGSLQVQLDTLVSGILGEDAKHLREISDVAGAPHDLGEWLRGSGDEELEDNSGRNIPIESLVAESQISSVLGCIFGRWDIRYASSERPATELPDPFAPLPVCPPGMLQGDDGLPLSPAAGRRLQAEGRYPIDVAWDGILVDDSEHPLDLERRVQAVIAVLWPDRADALEHEACALLGVSTLREWFRRSAGFFADHLKRYSKSRRQAPIYWQLSAGNGSYSAWLYYHRFTSDILYRVLRDFVEPRIQQAERDQFELESQDALPGDAATRLQEVQTLLQDLRLLKSELDLVAPLWNPNLNDGVIINHAILWRITPYTPWQKKCKECWDKLVKGDYDWAHLAFHLWPERVIPKCTTDRSLAIAHGLEERLWQETNNGNWLPRQLSEADLQTLIAERSNPAVKSALERFLAAPPPVAPTRSRASRSTRASGSTTPRRARGSAAVVDAEATRQVLLALTAAPSDGLAKTQIAELLGVEAASLTAVIKQLKATDQVEQLGAARGARYVLSEQGRAAVASQAGEDD
jgi:hypothetical protein